MGSSFTEYRKKGFWTRDGQIQVWLYLLIEEIDRLVDPPEWLLELRQKLLLQSTLGVNGAVSARLDRRGDLARSDVETLIKLSNEALTHLRERGPQLTLEVPFSFATDGPDTLCIDRDIRIFTCVGEAFIELLQGRLNTDASTSPCLWPPEVPYA